MVQPIPQPSKPHCSQVQKRPTVSASFNHKKPDQNILVGFKNYAKPHHFSFKIVAEKVYKLRESSYKFLRRQKQIESFLHLGIMNGIKNKARVSNY